MKFGEYEKVKVRADLEIGKNYGGFIAYDEMVNDYAGKIVLITNRFDKEQFYLTSGNAYCWTDEMFEDWTMEEKFDYDIVFKECK